MYRLPINNKAALHGCKPTSLIGKVQDYKVLLRSFSTKSCIPLLLTSTIIFGAAQYNPLLPWHLSNDLH